MISVHGEKILIEKEVFHDVFFQMRLSISQAVSKPIGGQSKFITVSNILIYGEHTLVDVVYLFWTKNHVVYFDFGERGEIDFRDCF